MRSITAYRQVKKMPLNFEPGQLPEWANEGKTMSYKEEIELYATLIYRLGSTRQVKDLFL